MTVSQKIITANTQPNDGQILVGVAGARGLDSASLIDSNHTLDTPISLNMGQPSGVINSNLQTRYDDQRYYTGDSA